MKKTRAFAACLVLVFGYATGAPLSAEQKSVQMFIKGLYSIDSLTFEMGRFDKKYDPKKQVELQAKFFSRDVMAKYKNPATDNGFVRHPSLGNEDLSGIGSVDPTKNPRILPPVISGDTGYVDVYPNLSGRTLYFLSKTEEGWRISNAASYEVWPPYDDGKCWEPLYLLKPTPEQLALETKECIKYRQTQASRK